MAHGDFLLQVLILLGAIVVVVPLVQRLGAGSVPGYLIAGLLVGPPLLGWVTEYTLIASVAEFGIVFLMFSIGIELRPARLWFMRRLVFGLGSCQILLCAAVIAAVLLWQGFTLAAATLTGFALALSSTAIVIQLLAERRELAVLRGRASLALLLMQDVAVAPLVMLVYLLGSSGASRADPLATALEALAMLAVVLVLGRLAWRHVLPLLAAQRNGDMLVAVALLLVLGAAWMMEHAGMSLAIGAFLAGVLLADSPFRHQVIADIQPFRGILLGLFFMSVGMSIDRATVIGSGFAVLGLTLGLMVLKALLIAGLLRAFRLTPADSVQGALLLSQAGEFGLVLFALAANQQLIDAQQKQLLLQMVVFSMLLTPLADLLGRRLARQLQRRDGPHPLPLLDGGPDVSGHVIIGGFGRVGRQISRLLDAAGVRWIASDLDSVTVEHARVAGLPVFFGDCGRSEILRALHADQARLVLITLDDASATERCLLALRQITPDCRVIARAADHARAHALLEHGVLRAVPETTEYSLQLGLVGLTELGVDAALRQGLEDGFRDHEYARLLGRETPSTTAQRATAATLGGQ